MKLEFPKSDRRAFSARLQHALALFHVDDFDSAAGNPIAREVREASEAGFPDDNIADVLVAAYRAGKETACNNLATATKARKARIHVPVKRMDR